MMLWREARRNWASTFDRRFSILSRGWGALVGGGGGGAEDVEVWDMHRAGWKARVSDGMLRKARKTVLSDMVGVPGALEGARCLWSVLQV